MMRLTVHGKFLGKPMSGIGRYACEMALALHEIGVTCHFLNDGSTHPSFESYSQSLRVDKKPDPSNLFWGPNHRLPLSLPPSTPTVLSVLDLVWKKHPETMRLRTKLAETILFPRAIDRADRIACLSKSTADDLAFFYPRVAEKIRIVYPGASAPSVRPKRTGQPFALFVGTFEPRKNLERLIIAYSRLPETLKAKCTLKIAGKNGWGGVNLGNLIKGENSEKWVEVIYGPSDQQLGQLYADCSFLVMPSIYEGFGLPIIEAMQYGKPCITSKVSSMPEIAGDAGILVNPFSVSDISTALEQLIVDDLKRIDLAGHAKRTACQFTWLESARSLKKILLELV